MAIHLVSQHPKEMSNICLESLMRSTTHQTESQEASYSSWPDLWNLWRACWGCHSRLMELQTSVASVGQGSMDPVTSMHSKCRLCWPPYQGSSSRQRLWAGTIHNDMLGIVAKMKQASASPRSRLHQPGWSEGKVLSWKVSQRDWLDATPISDNSGSEMDATEIPQVQSQLWWCCL